jgi:hypothetical protein
MAFPIGIIFTGASFLLDRLPGILASFGTSVPQEAMSGARLALDLGPKAIQLLEDMQAGSVSPADVQTRWTEARDAVIAGNAAWDAAAPKPPAA